VPPLDAEARAILWSTAPDEAPEVRGAIADGLRDRSYTIGNEWTLWAFADDIRGLGGAYVGVGSDQAYLFLGWQRPEIAWFIDYDPRVLRVHAVYEALLLGSESPQAFLRLFRPQHEAEAIALIEAHYADDPHTARVARLSYRSNRRFIDFRLRGLVRRLKSAPQQTFLDDQETFDFVKAMIRAGRVRPLLVNLLDERGVSELAEATRRLGVPIRVLYLSNAEEYWKGYSDVFRANVAKLPADPESVVLRTKLVWDVNHDYVYVAQGLQDFQARLGSPLLRVVDDLFGGMAPARDGAINHHRIPQLQAANSSPASGP
jgi:hypothetical protein